jgi:NAD(P)H-hydrate epimerase
MRLIDKKTMEMVGIPGMVLMENAGSGVRRVVAEMLGSAFEKKRVWIFCGIGNNGGDGLVVARQLAEQGLRVKVILLGDPNQFNGDALLNYRIAQRLGIEMLEAREQRDLVALKLGLAGVDLVVDAIFGTGLQGAIEGEAADIVRMINNAEKLVVAVDIPSGFDGDSGTMPEVCIVADVTVTFGLPKLGLLLGMNNAPVGRLEIVDIGIPRSVVEQMQLRANWLQADLLRNLFLKRSATSHKGDYGHLLVVGGSTGYGGAPMLSCEGALRSGAGLVTVAVPASLFNGLCGSSPEGMVRPLPDNVSGCLVTEAADAIVQRLDDASALVVGPGLSDHADTRGMLARLLPRLSLPTVFDADALNIISQDRHIWRLPEVPAVMTPHPGEMARLMGISIAAVQASRVDVARQAAAAFGAHIVLKGHRTIVCSPEGEVFINSNGNPGMATGGSGDVLAGMIGAFLARGMETTSACNAAVFLHGLAADLAVRECGEESMLPRDILAQLPAAFRHLQGAQ